jgi:hypothetical protein
MNVTVLVVIALVVGAASLASYLLSHWSSIRNSNRSLGWATLGIGTTLLLAAAAIVVLATGLMPAFQLPMNEPAEHGPGSAWANDGTAGPERNRQGATSDASGTTTGPNPDRAGQLTANRHPTDGNVQSANQAETSAATRSPDSRGDPMLAKSTAPSVVFTETDPWAATSCVYAFNPHSTDPTRWTIDNECGVPVGILIASCSRPSLECQIDGMTLPAKFQRSVTIEEETRYGGQIRYVACAIDPGSETRSSPSQQLDSDACLTRVHTLSDLGRRSGKSLEALVGANAPIKVRPSGER